MNNSNIEKEFSLDSENEENSNTNFIKELELLQKQAKTFFINNDIINKQNLNNKLNTNFIWNNKNDDFSFKKKTYIENNHSKEYTLTFNQWKHIILYERRKNISYSILKTSLRNGIDDELRPRIWCFLIDLDTLMKGYSPEIYKKLIKMENINEEQIDKDIYRTYNKEYIFSNQNKENIQYKLKNILLAYSNFDKEVGYVQGMNFIAAAILYNLYENNYKNIEYSFGKKYQNYEELSFWLLVYIFNNINWRYIFIENFPKLYTILENLKIKIKNEYIDIYNKFIENNIEFIEIFCNSIFSIILYKIPWKYSKIILDLFLLEEEKFIFEIILRLIDINYSKIYSLKNKEEIIFYFNNNFFQESFNENQDNLKIIFPYPLIENII